MSSTYNEIAGPKDWVCHACKRSRGQHDCLGGFVREKHDFVAMLRVKNEARWMPEVLESILPLCTRVFVFDDHSTDETVTICGRYPQVTVFKSPFEGMNESRDKNWLLDQIMVACEPAWILCVDGDEVLEKNGPAIIRKTCAEHPEVDAYSLRIAFMWDQRDLVRVDRIYGDFWRPSLFRPFVERPGVPDDHALAQEFRFKSTPWGRKRGDDQPNLHCSSVPQRRIHGRKACAVRLKHYGYLHREDRVRKLDFYTSIDWENASEDCYRHMTQGDDVGMSELPRIAEMISAGIVTEDHARSLIGIPPTASLLHAGPLQVVPWDESAPWELSNWARVQHGMD